MSNTDFQNWLSSHIYSPSELEAYLLCPYRFYATAYLKLEPEKEWEIEMTPAETGSLIHRVLERFLSPHFRKESEREFEENNRKILSLLREELTSFKKDRPNLSQVLLEQHEKKISRTLTNFVEEDISQWSSQKTLTPKHLEWSFGKNSPPLEIPTPNGKPIQIRGRIDRIDVDEANKRFLVIDYKTGSRKITGSQIRRGESLQLPLYILAVQKILLPDYEPIGGIYYQLSDMSKKDGILHTDRLPDFLEIHPRSSSLVSAPKWDEIFETTEEKVRNVVSGINKGDFPSHLETCEPYCPYQDLCRVRKNGS